MNDSVVNDHCLGHLTGTEGSAEFCQVWMQTTVHTSQELLKNLCKCYGSIWDRLNLFIAVCMVLYPRALGIGEESSHNVKTFSAHT